MRNLSARGDIAAFLAMDVMREAKAKSLAGAAICHMEVGQPGTKAPRLVRERAKQMIDGEKLGYTEALGIPLLRQRIARHYKDCYGAVVSAEQVVITTGSSAGFVLAFLATLDVGDAVAIMRPGYPCYREILKVLGLKVVDLPVGFDNGWVPTEAQVSEAIELHDVKAVLFASPANPTGAVVPPARLEAISNLLRAKGVWLLADEIYHGLVYEAASPTAARLGGATGPGDYPDHVIILNSFSKYYSMTGWRVGWMVVPPALTRRMEKLNQHLFISAPALSQEAAVAAFDAVEELEAIKAQYARNRQILTEGLVAAGIERFAPPDGAFYIYADVSRFTDDSLGFSATLLEEYGIAASPGVDFDDVDGRYMMRFSYAGAEAEVIEAVRRLKARPPGG